MNKMPAISVTSPSLLLLQLIVTELDGEMKEKSSRRTILQLSKEHDQRELMKIRKDIISLQKQFEVARHRKNEIFECIIQLSKLHD
jgi:hypothetical protein